MEQSEKSKSQTSPGQDVFEGQWRQMRGTLRSWWGKLTDNDWERIAGQKDKLLGVLQEKYGYTRDMAHHEIERRFSEHDKQPNGTYVSPTLGADAQQHKPSTASQPTGTQGHSMTDVPQVLTQTIHGARQKPYTLRARPSEGIDRAKAAVGKKMSAFADTLRRNVARESSVGSATHTVANRLSVAGSYLEEHTVEDVTKEATALIQRYPMQALLIGFGVGYLISRGLER